MLNLLKKFLLPDEITQNFIMTDAKLYADMCVNVSSS